MLYIYELVGFRNGFFLFRLELRFHAPPFCLPQTGDAEQAVADFLRTYSIPDFSALPIATAALLFPHNLPQVLFCSEPLGIGGHR